MDKLTFSKSSSVTAVEYDGEKKELFVTFKSGKTYKYLDVPAEVYEGCKSTEEGFSIGKYINSNVAKAFEFEAVID